MSDDTILERQRGAEAWSDYWKRASSETQALENASLTTRLEQVWSRRIDQIIQTGAPEHVAELACGAAPVLRRYAGRAVSAGKTSRLTALDVSTEALDLARQALAGFQVAFVEARADATGLPAGSFDLIFSQFGLEYAGPEAFAEAGRLLAPAGRFIGIVHARDGGIHKESEANARALDAISQARILERVEALIAIDDPSASGARTTGEAELQQALAGLFDTLRAIAPCAARHFVARLGDDAFVLYQRRSNYAPADRDNWIAHQKQAVESYRFRMETMLRASLSQAGLEAIVNTWDGQGVSAAFEPLLLGRNEEQIGWIVEAERIAG